MQKSMILALLKGFCIHKNEIYYSPALWKHFLDHKAQVAAFAASVGGESRIFWMELGNVPEHWNLAG